MADEISKVAPSSVMEELQRGLDWHAEGQSGDGLVPATVAWARRLANGDPITRDKAVKMRAWLARHEVDKQGQGFNRGEPGYPSPGRVAWALWGGDPAVAWSDKMVKAFEREQKDEHMKQDSIRIDRGELMPAHTSPEGFLFVEGRPTRAGVFLYKRADGSILRELRPPEEVGSAESLATLARKPITNEHPPEFVDAANAEKYAAGSVDPEVVWEQDHLDGFVRVKGTVMREDAIRAIQDGRLELSCGYHADIDETPGVWTDSQGKEHRYDAIQRNIRYNHLALVDRGRAGKQARLRLDSVDASRIDFVPDFEDLPLAPSDYTWDSAAAIRRVREWADAEEAPNAKFAQAFMWFDADNADTFGAYKLPFADIVDGELHAVPRALNAISSVLGGGRGGVDISEDDKELVRGLIDKYREKMDMDHGNEKEKHMDNEQTSMLLVRVDDREYSVTEPHAIQRAIVDHEAKLRGEFDAMSSELETAKTAQAEMQAKLDSVQAELDAMRVDSERDDEAERIAWANERFILLSQAKSLKMDAGELTNDEIKREIVKRHFDGEENENLDSKAYVDSVYDYLKRKQQVVKTTEQLATGLLKSEETRGDDSKSGLADAQSKYLDYIRNIYN